MNKKQKSIFIASVLILLLLGVSTVTATDNKTATNNDKIIDTSQVTSSYTTLREEVTTTTSDDYVETNAKNTEKEHKNIKTATKTVVVNNATELIDAINYAVNDTENDDYIINLNKGNYTYYPSVQFSGNSSKTILINGNNQTLGGNSYFRFINGCIFIFKDLKITNNIELYNNASLNNIVSNKSFDLETRNMKVNITNSNLYIHCNQNNINLNITNSNIGILNTGLTTLENSTLSGTVNKMGATILMNSGVINAEIYNNGNFIIGNDVEFTGNASLKGSVNYTIDDFNRILPYIEVYNGTYTINGATILKYKGNYGNLTLKNSLINSVIYNEGNITFDDDCIFGENCQLLGSGDYQIDNPSNILPYFPSYNGTFTIENAIISKYKDNYGNLTINNSIIKNVFSNYGKLTMNNTLLNARLQNYHGGYSLLNNCSINSQINNQANMTINNSNMNSTNTFTNNGDLIILNSNINQPITNEADRTITIINSTITSTITNNGKLIIDDDTNYGLNALIDGPGRISINDTDKIAPYLQTYNGNYTLNNLTIINLKTNNGNLTVNNSNISHIIINRGKLDVNNSNINNQLTNQGTLNIYNSTLNARIANSGTLIIDEDSIATENFTITGTGQVFTNNTQLIELLKESNVYLGENTIENTTLNTPIINQGKLTIKNSTINTTITNNGLLVIDENNIFTDETKISGIGEVVTEDLTMIIPYLSDINGTYTIENMTFTETINFRGDITLVNCVINYVDLCNYALLTLKNCTVNGMIYNYDVIFVYNDTLVNESITNSESAIVIYGDIHDVINPRSFEGDNTVENMTFIIPSTNTGNLRIVNCNITASISNLGNMTIINSNITAKIDNNANITFEKCSFSNNAINTTINDNVGNLGFLLYNYNNGNTSLIDCIMENNTFNINKYSSYEFDKSNGAIYNNAYMSIVNCSFYNNSIGYSIVDITSSTMQGFHFGRGCAIVNNGTLNVDYSNFTCNYAGESGGAIYSTVGVYYNTTLEVNNSYFADNKAGLQGGAISFFGTGSIQNTVFINNSEVLNHNVIGNTGGGAIYSAGENQIITNCTFNKNKAICEVTGLMYVGSTGGAIRSTTNNLIINESKFINNYASTSGSTLTTAIVVPGIDNIIEGYSATVINCYFESNETDPSVDIIMGNPNLKNNTFTNINNTDYIIRTPLSNNHGFKNTITENTFKNNKANINTIQYTPPELLEQNNITTENNTYQNTTLNDKLELIIPNNSNTQEPITITGTYTINNPENYDADILEQNKFQVYINGVLDQTVDTLEFTITPTNTNTMVTVQPTISQTRKTIIIKETSSTNITITPENYDEYIYEGALIGVEENSKVTFKGTFTDKEEIYIDINNIIINGENATFTNTTFTLDKPNITLKNMNIHNTNTTYPIKIYNDNNIIQNNNITLYNIMGDTAAIYAKASNTIITNNTINVTGPAGDIDWESDSSGICTTQAILVIESENNTITYNNITVNGTNIGETFGTIEAITNSRIIKNSLIAYNNITVTGGYFNYAINQLDRINNSTVTDNNILSIGFRYADGIQIGDNATDILIARNNITCICLNDTPVDEAAITYGIITTCQGGDPSDNFTITENNINLTGVINYGMEVYKTTNTKIYDNNITLNGQKSMGIGYCLSPDSTFTQNTIIINDKNITTTNPVTEEIQPQTTGIKIQGSENITINQNIIIITDANKEDTTIETESSDNTITNNKLISSQGYGADTIKTFKPGIIIENNTITTTTQIEDINTYNNQETTISATVKDEFENNITGGTVTFTDDEGNTIATAQVVDGTAVTTATFTDTGESTITATYTPTSTGLTTSNNTATLTVKKIIYDTITLDDIEAIPGKHVTLTARIHYEDNENITGGKITFKINGKTLKDANGKTIYAKVVNGSASVNYTIPQDQAGQKINMTIIYSGTAKYAQAKTNKEITIQTLEPSLTITPLIEPVTTCSTVTLKSKVALGDTPITTGKIVFKINGKTVKDANGKVIYAKVDANGEVSVDYNLGDLKANTYTVEAIFTATGYDKLQSNTTMTVVKA